MTKIVTYAMAKPYETLKDRFKKVTSIFLLGVTLVLGASAMVSSKAEAATPWNNQGPRMERWDNGNQKAYEKRQKEIQKKREAEARKRREAEIRRRKEEERRQRQQNQNKKRPPMQQKAGWWK